MARGVQLEDLVERFKAETGQSTLVSAGLDDLVAIKHFLRRTQELLWAEYDWPHLQVLGPDSKVTLAAGSRYYDFPTGLSPEGIEEAQVLFGGIYTPVEKGISFDQYNEYNSDDTTARSDPVMRWDTRDVDSVLQIEVWPLPASNDQVLQFRGIRDLNPFTSNSHTCDLDDLLIVLFAAADVLLDQGSGKAQRVADMASARLRRLRCRSRGGRAPIILRGGMVRESAPRGHITISVR